MKIVDSLLNFNFFSLWRGAGEPLAFVYLKQRTSQGDGALPPADNLDPS